jgi:2-polyprenyl-3-methyl-5-hydroxy-6-metoxy-1,4-benzoquinol methylase
MNAAALREVLALPFFKLLGYRPQTVSVETWDSEYRAGRWDYLDTLDNIGGLLTVFGYCQYLSPNSILDVGCGEGLLAKKLTALDYEKYLGIDISSEAVAKAVKLRGDARTRFSVSNALTFVAQTPFDVIVFNQSLYYMPDPVGAIRRYAGFLTSSGRMIVSMYDCGRTRAAWSLIADHIDVEDSITVVQGSARGTTKLVRPR